MYVVDSETCGYEGPAVLIQYSKDRGPIELHEIWRRPCSDTIELIEDIVKDDYVGFNNAFDWYQICKIYTMLIQADDLNSPPVIEEMALKEPKARDGPCLRPRSSLDLMLHARRGPYQNLMARDDIKIRRVPTALAPFLVRELTARIPLRDIFFAKSKDNERWQIVPIKGTNDFVNVVLKFKAAGGLKELHADITGEKLMKFKEIKLPKKYSPNELAFAPFALAVGRPGAWNGAWPDVIQAHIDFYAFHDLARQYAHDDVRITTSLYDHFGCPAFGDKDSELAILSGAAKWKGYAVNLKGIAALLRREEEEMKKAPRSRAQILAYVMEVLSPVEQLAMRDEFGAVSTKKVVLEEVAKFQNEGGRRAAACLSAKKAEKRVYLYKALLTAGRFHCSTKIIGARSGRMSGGSETEGKMKKKGSISPHGIQKLDLVRAQFPFAFTEGFQEVLGLDTTPEETDAGDFEGFELGIADAFFQDPELHNALVGPEIGRDGKTPTGKTNKPHAVVGELFFPPKTYWDIIDSKGTADDLYTKSKSGFFAELYFGNDFTLKSRLGVDSDSARKAHDNLMNRFRVMNRKREQFRDDFCPMTQPDGPGTRVIWKQPAEYCESMLGFRRYFTLENQICEALFKLAEKPPTEWRKLKVRVIRREGHPQTASGACQSALFGCAFTIQGQNMRAAGNHKIQSTGAELTKELQMAIWELQPRGSIGEWIVRPLNIHDEIVCVRKKGVKTSHIVKAFLERRRSLIPLIDMKWKVGISNWSNK